MRNSDEFSKNQSDFTSILSSDDESDNVKTSKKTSLKKSEDKFIISDSDDSNTEDFIRHSSFSPEKQSDVTANPKSISKNNKFGSPTKKEWNGPDIKLNLKPLGLNSEMKKWVESVKNNPIVSSSTFAVGLLNRT